MGDAFSVPFILSCQCSFNNISSKHRETTDRQVCEISRNSLDGIPTFLELKLKGYFVHVPLNCYM